MHQPSLTDLRLFLAVVEAGSITAGAARHGIALAAASARLKGLEADLGSRLLARGRRGVALTSAGEALAHQARLVLGQMARLSEEMAAHAGGLRGEVLLYGNTAALAEFLPETLARFLLAHPGIDLRLVERGSHGVAEALAQDGAALGVLADWADMAGLEWRPYGLDRLVLLAPRGHALAQRERLRFEEALGEDFVGLAEGSALQAHLARQAARAGRPLRLRARLTGFDGLCRMVAGGVGLAVMPEVAARRHGRGLARIRLEDDWAKRRLLIAARRFAALPGPARALAEHLTP
ncbi:LysR family transcriptional regulator [Acetobacteraceae bacterium H6797]|nr:LysR family transcriptional regulator [Acetobacteraceae bacterium H6797]